MPQALAVDVERNLRSPLTGIGALAAAIAPKSDGWSTSGGKKSVVLTSATSGATW